jgi:hypothetical protein
MAAPPAVAQIFDRVGPVLGGQPRSGGVNDDNTGGGALGSLGGDGVPLVGGATAGNTAGVLQYCVNNNYLSGMTASSVKDSLVRKIPGQGASDPGFRAGSNGTLETGSGERYSLGGGDIKAQATYKVCDLMLQHAKSLL